MKVNIFIIILFTIQVNSVYSQDNRVTYERSFFVGYSNYIYDSLKYVKSFENDSIEVFTDPKFRIKYVTFSKISDSLSIDLSVVSETELHSYFVNLKNNYCTLSKTCFTNGGEIFLEANPFVNMWWIGDNKLLLKYICMDNPDFNDEFMMIIKFN